MLFTRIVCLSYLGSDILNLETVQRWETDILQRRDGLEQMSIKRIFLILFCILYVVKQE